jgi:predicted enzyme related to lactoylglutathione lyase
MDVTGIAGVIIWTEPDRHAAMAAFYRDLVGLLPRSDREGFINFEWGEFRLTIAEHTAVDGQSRDPLRTMVNLAVTDIHAVHERLEAAGVAFSRPPEPEPWGGWIATFNDPDGNTVQLMQVRSNQ